MNATKNTAAQRRTQYSKSIDNVVRSFGSYLSLVKADADAVQINDLKAEAAEAAEALKAAKAAEKAAEKAAKDDATKADAAKAAKADVQHAAQAVANYDKRLQIAAEIINTAPVRYEQAKAVLADVSLQRSEININFLRTWLPDAINKAGQICDCKKIALEDEQAAIAAEAETGFEHKYSESGTLVELRPVRLWTASKLLTKFAKAAKAKAKAASAEAQAVREQERAERERQRYLANLRRVQEYERKHKVAEQPAEQPAEQSK